MQSHERKDAIIGWFLVAGCCIALGVMLLSGCSVARYEHLGPGEGEVHRAWAVSLLLWSKGSVVLADGANLDFEQDTSEQAAPIAEAVARGAVSGALKGQ